MDSDEMMMVTDRVTDATEIREEEFPRDSVCRVDVLEKQQHLLKPRTKKIIHKQKAHICPACSHLGRREASFYYIFHKKKIKKNPKTLKLDYAQ